MSCLVEQSYSQKDDLMRPHMSSYSGPKGCHIVLLFLPPGCKKYIYILINREIHQLLR